MFEGQFIQQILLHLLFTQILLSVCIDISEVYNFFSNSVPRFTSLLCFLNQRQADLIWIADPVPWNP